MKYYKNADMHDHYEKWLAFINHYVMECLYDSCQDVNVSKIDSKLIAGKIK